MNSAPHPMPSLVALTVPQVKLDDPLDEREPEPQAAPPAVERLFGLRERLEEPFEHVPRDAGAGIADVKLGRRLPPLEDKLHPPPPGRELGGVAEEVPDHLGDPCLIAAHPHRLGGDPTLEGVRRHA